MKFSRPTSTLPAANTASFIDVTIEWSGWHLRVRQLPAAISDTSEILDDLRAFRAQILYSEGRRPEFRDRAGRYVDADLLDHGSYHFTAHSSPNVAPSAYIRLAPPILASYFQTRDLLGDDDFAALLDANNLVQDAVYEGSRLVVAEHARGAGLGTFMNAITIATGEMLGADGFIATSGMDSGQHRLHERFGFAVFPETQRYSARYDDRVCVIVRKARDRLGMHADLIGEIQGVLCGTTFAVTI